MHRTGRRGLGVSYIDGFRHAVAIGRGSRRARWTPTCSHDPQDLPAMIAAAGRRGPRDRLALHARHQRRELAAAAHHARVASPTSTSGAVTGLGVRDCTSGYRCWRREALATLPLDRIVSEGYPFVVEVTFLAAVYGLRIAESPIIFIERREGASKLSSGILLESLLTPWRLVIRHGRVRNGAAGRGRRDTIRSEAPR